jgi:hypothetical protein
MMPRFARALLTGLAFASVLWITAQTRVDVDLWGHVRFGLDILGAGALHERDPYSFTSDRPWINHEWLSEVIFAAAWRAAGTPGLILVKLMCLFGALALTAGTLRAKAVTGHARWMVLGLTLVGILPRSAQVRPQIFSVLLFAALVRAFVHAETRSPLTLFLTIPIVILWVNVHGGWIVGLATVALWCGGETYANRAQPRRAAVALGCAATAAVATLLNPYGVGLWTFLLETVRFGREAIREWGPVWAEPVSFLVWGVFALLFVAGARRMAWPRNPAVALIPAAWGVAAFQVSRLDAFFALSVSGLLAVPVASLFRERARNREPLPRAWQIGSAGLALAAMLSVPPSRQAFTCIGFLTSRWPEPEVVELARQRALTGRIVTYFDWGEYGIWHLPPSLEISMDGRRETVYTDRTISGHLRLYLGTDEGLAYLETLDADYVWLPRLSPALVRLSERGWVRLFEGPRSSLLARADALPAMGDPVVIASDPPPRCFPGP